MRIINGGEMPTLIKFGDLFAGECFMCPNTDDTLFMKMEQIGTSIKNAVNLRSGSYYNFEDDNEVSKRDAVILLYNK